MNATKQAGWLFLTMISLACLGGYFASSTLITQLDEQTLAKTPNYIVKDLSVRQFNSQGKLINHLMAPEMISIPENNTHWLKSPHIISKQDDQEPWEIFSKKAHSINRGEQITFIKHVIIHQEKSNHNEESTFKTEKLIYFPKNKYATTNQAISFEQPGSIVHSVGMQANLETKHVKLLNKAEATFEPNHG